MNKNEGIGGLCVGVHFGLTSSQNNLSHGDQKNRPKTDKTFTSVQ